jgi:hypothetical protein
MRRTRNASAGRTAYVSRPKPTSCSTAGSSRFSDGRVLVSPVADEKSLVKLGLDPERPFDVGCFSDTQERFLEFHRREVSRSASL